MEGGNLSFSIYKAYREVLREYSSDEKAKKYLNDIDYLNYRLYQYATCTQKMTPTAFDLEVRREFRTSTSNVLEAYMYLRKIGFYDRAYKSAIKCRKINNIETEM